MRRDIKVCSLAKQEGINATFVHDKCIVDPGAIVSAENKPYVVRIGPPAHKNLKSSLCFPRSIRHIKEDGW